MKAVFKRCPEGCRRGWIAIVITPFGSGPVSGMCGGGAVRCSCPVPGYRLEITRPAP
jgi:hypothetical protein